MGLAELGSILAAICGNSSEYIPAMFRTALVWPRTLVENRHGSQTAHVQEEGTRGQHLLRFGRRRHVRIKGVLGHPPRAHQIPPILSRRWNTKVHVPRIEASAGKSLQNNDKCDGGFYCHRACLDEPKNVIINFASHQVIDFQLSFSCVRTTPPLTFWNYFWRRYNDNLLQRKLI